MTIRPRPRFERYTSLEANQFRERLVSAVDQAGSDLSSEVLENHAQIMIGRSRRHTWSPCLSLTFTALEDENGRRLRIRGLFGPHPSLWTFIATLYCFSAFLIFFGTMVGWSQSLIDSRPWGFLGVPAGIVLGVALYGVSMSGQALAHAEMDELSTLLDSALEESQTRTR